MGHRKYEKVFKTMAWNICNHDVFEGLRRNEQWFLNLLIYEKVFLWQEYGIPIVPDPQNNKLHTADAAIPVLKTLLCPLFIDQYFRFHSIAPEFLQNWKQYDDTTKYKYIQHMKQIVILSAKSEEKIMHGLDDIKSSTASTAYYYKNIVKNVDILDELDTKITGLIIAAFAWMLRFYMERNIYKCIKLLLKFKNEVKTRNWIITNKEYHHCTILNELNATYLNNKHIQYNLDKNHLICKPKNKRISTNYDIVIIPGFKILKKGSIMNIKKIVQTKYNKRCAVCMISFKGNKKCSNCKEIFYCSKRHQKIDWKNNHRLHCIL